MPFLASIVACVAGVEGEGKGKKRAREVRDEGAREARVGPFPPILRPATQATSIGAVPMIWDNFAVFKTNCAIACGTRVYRWDHSIPLELTEEK